MEKPKWFWKWLCVCVLMVGATGCNIRKLAIHQMGPVIQKGFPVFYSEGDLEVAKIAMASNIKLLETFLQTAPEDEVLLLATSQALCAYAFGFAETEFERYKFTDIARSEAEKARARDLYHRSFEYARRAVAVRQPKLAAAADKSLKEFESELTHAKAKDVPNLFWMAFSWGGFINLSKDSISTVSEIVKTEALMRKVVQYDENYFNGGAHMFLGVFYGSRPKMFGGDPKMSREHFTKVNGINRDKLLMPKVLHAQYLAAQELDRPQFDRLLNEVLSADENIFPEQKLMNQMAKERAKIIKSQAEFIF